MSVRRHTGYNLVGSIVPIVLAIATVPIYLRLVGPDRYGVLAIAWLLLGYFGLFDLGLGQATAFRIAALRDASAGARAGTFWAALAVNSAMGIVGAAILWMVGLWFFGHVFKAPEKLRPEILRSVPLLAASVPVATVTGVLTGALQGREKFLESNLISTISTCLFQILPFAAAWRFGPDLTLLLGAALVARLLAVFVLGIRCHAELGRGQRVRVDIQDVLPLLRYGGWVTVASVFGPSLVIVDRFYIGAVLGSAAVAIYSVPYTMAARVALAPSSLTTALFPRMAAASSREQTRMRDQATQALACLMGPPVVGAIFLIDLILHLWVGNRIAAQAAPVGRILLIGFWANGFALIPYTGLQASGRPDLVSKILIAQIPPYFILLYVSIMHFGLVGAAWALAARFAIDYGLLTYAAGKNFRALPLLAVNFGLLLASAYLASVWTVSSPYWWVSLFSLFSCMCIIGWLNIPVDLRSKALEALRMRIVRQA